MYPPRDKGGRWRASWHEDGERKQCESVSEEKLAAKLEKVRQRLATGAANMTRPGTDLIAWYLNPNRLPVERRWSRKHADSQRRLCERFAAPVIGAVTCQDIAAVHTQKIVNAAPTAGEGGRVHRMLSALVGAGNVKLHRSLGMWGIAHATAIMIFGLMLQLIATRSAMLKGLAPGTDGLYLGLCAFAGFSLMFTLAIRNRQRPEIHKRMILFAMLPVLPPGVNRFWSEALGLEPIPVVPLYLTLWTMALAILIHEWRRTGRISGYSLFGAGWIFVEGAMHKVVVHSPPFDSFAAGLLGLVHYR